MLGIVTLVMMIITSVFVYVVNSAMLIEYGINNEVEYYDSFNKVDATLSIIIREENTDPLFLQGLETYMGVSITDTGNGVYEISDGYSETKTMKSYFSVTTGGINTFDSFLQYTGTEPGFSLNPLITAEKMMSNYMVDLQEASFPAANPADPNATFAETMTYVQYLVTQGYFVQRTASQLTGQSNPTVTGFWYISGNVTIPDRKNLTIQEGYILVVNGNLEMGQRSTFTGTVIVSGNFTVDGASNKYETVRGTIYSGGNFLSDPQLNLGTVSRPTFIFAKNDITINKQTRYYAYFLSNRFIVISSASVTITGGKYATTSADPLSISANPSLTEAQLPGYKVTQSIRSGSGGFSIIHTSPQPG